jgi:hypothetical protein
MIEAVSTSVNIYQTTQRDIPEDSHLHTHRENLKSRLKHPTSASFTAFKEKNHHATL